MRNAYESVIASQVVNATTPISHMSTGGTLLLSFGVIAALPKVLPDSPWQGEDVAGTLTWAEGARVAHGADVGEDKSNWVPRESVRRRRRLTQGNPSWVHRPSIGSLAGGLLGTTPDSRGSPGNDMMSAVASVTLF